MIGEEPVAGRSLYCASLLQLCLSSYHSSFPPFPFPILASSSLCFSCTAVYFRTLQISFLLVALALLTLKRINKQDRSNKVARCDFASVPTLIVIDTGNMSVQLRVWRTVLYDMHA